MNQNLPYVVGITGASGAPYARRLLQVLLEKKMQVHLLLTDSARQVIKEETEVDLGNSKASIEKGLETFLGKGFQKFVTYHDLNDWNSPLASGSVRSGPMVIVPCSVHTLAAIASSFGSNLLERRADIMLKERRKLIVVFREMPLHTGHLEHLLKLSQMGATILPAMPGFYHRPKRVQDLVDFVVGRILDHLEIPSNLFKRWRS